MIADSTKTPTSLRGRGHSEARATGALLLGSAFFVALALALPHPSGGDFAALVATGAAMAVIGSLCLAFASRVPLPATHVLLVLTVAATGALILESGVAAGQYGQIYVWSTLVTAYYFRRRVAVAHLGWVLASYGVVLALVPSTAGYSPLTRWLITAVALAVVMTMVSVIVSHRARADHRARRFFELTRDMLTTMDLEGRCVEANEAWQRTLGYLPSELVGRRLLDLTHPDDHQRAIQQAVDLFGGAESVDLETRVRGKDGAWHWLRTTSAISPHENLVYARSVDVTERRRIAAEREELLRKVESLARHDPLTGLPNRRTLDELVPREMSRARRSDRPLSLAIVDIDRFKNYNDAHGHLAGDELLRQCAIDWDGALRGSDTIVRFGGEEFLVLLPDTELEQALEIVERLRAATPGDQTCSAGVAAWDGTADVDGLIGIADDALYRAKDEGRDRLVAAPAPV